MNKLPKLDYFKEVANKIVKRKHYELKQYQQMKINIYLTTFLTIEKSQITIHNLPLTTHYSLFTKKPVKTIQNGTKQHLYKTKPYFNFIENQNGKLWQK